MELNQTTDVTVDSSLESFMDVVMTYRCKLCDFTGNQPQDIATHIKNKHLPPSGPSQSSSHSMPDAPVFKPRHHFPQKPDPDSNMAPTTEISTELQVTSVSAETETIISDEIHVEHNQVKNMDITGLQMAANNTTSGSDKSGSLVFLTSSETPDSESSRAASHIDLELTSAVSIPTTNMNSTISTASGHSAPNTTVTRELFLCGQCTLGFNNMEDCKLHMIQAHNAILPSEDSTAVAQQEESTSTVSEKVSVGTQVNQRKKPGRKPKGSQEEAAPVHPESPDEEECTIVIGGTRSRPRRIKTPKSLQKDYFLEKTKIKTREKAHLDMYTLKCKEPGCFARFKTQASLDTHHKCHRIGEDVYAFQCFECTKIFTKWKELRFHLWRTHRIDTDLLSCEDCLFKTDTMHKLKIHREIHGEDRNYKCDICGKSYKQLAQMHNHRSVHILSDDPDKWYTFKECDICKRTFANQKCLAKHMQAIHCKVKPYVCSYCGYAASRKAMLQLHVRTHTGEKPFKCDLCSYVTGDHNSLRRHKMRHTGNKPYKCQYCPYACIQAISLKCHMKNKHPGLAGVFFCDLCQYRTVSKQNYTNHQKDHENGLLPVTRTPAVTAGSSDVQTSQVITIGATGDAGEIQTTETQISTEDLAKLTANYERLMPSDVSAAQLIYSALNAMSQNVPPASAQQGGNVLEEVQTTISTGAEDQDGVTTHTITFHLAAPDDQSTVANVGSDHTGSVLLTPTLPVQLIQGNQVGTVALPTVNQISVSLPNCSSAGTVTLPSANHVGTMSLSSNSNVVTVSLPSGNQDGTVSVPNGSHPVTVSLPTAGQVGTLQLGSGIPVGTISGQTGNQVGTVSVPNGSQIETVAIPYCAQAIPAEEVHVETITVNESGVVQSQGS